MDLYIVNGDSLVEYNNGELLNPPIRTEFLVSSHEIEDPVIIEYAKNFASSGSVSYDFVEETEQLKLTLAMKLNGKFFYSVPYNFISRFSIGEFTPTPTPSQTPSSVKCCDNFEFTLFAEGGVESDTINQINFLSDIA